MGVWGVSERREAKNTENTGELNEKDKRSEYCAGTKANVGVYCLMLWRVINGIGAILYAFLPSHICFGELGEKSNIRRRMTHTET